MLTSLILAAVVANVNLAVANVALPDIGTTFGATQTELDLVAVGYTLGLASSVLYLSAVADRHGRKRMVVAGTFLSLPACLISAFAPTLTILIIARIFGGLAAGMAFPTTLSLVTALWKGPARTSAIALWGGVGAAAVAFSPAVAGALMTRFWWGSAFLIALPVGLAALVLVIVFVPGHTASTSQPVDHKGGVLSIVCVASAVLAINFASQPGQGWLTLSLSGLGVLTGWLFVRHLRAATFPIFDLRMAGRRTFWTVSCAGAVLYGTRLGALFIGQQFLQNVHGYTALKAGLAMTPVVILNILSVPLSAMLLRRRGSRVTILVGYIFCCAGLLVMLLWGEYSPYSSILLAYSLLGFGVGFAGTPVNYSLTASVPSARTGMASAVAALQRDLGGAVMQSILGSILTLEYSASFSKHVPAGSGYDHIATSVQAQLAKSFSLASAIAERYPQYAHAIVVAAKESFEGGSDWACSASIASIAGGAILVLRTFPGKAEEERLYRSYAEADAQPPPDGVGKGDA
ncbi:MFS transporter [Streptomyces sp. NPDC127084]|uniref:MFS transporter n=1 Tax=Streptomyces sp. NPDC127084 TaxID=3347133 RepID=UPI0036607BA8